MTTAPPHTPRFGSIHRSVALCAIACAVACNLEATVIESVNASASPNATMSWAAVDVGWMYTPSLSYYLTEVETRFRTADSRIVTLELYSDPPSTGGALLRSSTFTPISDTFSGGSFAPLWITANEPFFIGFRNVAGLGANTTTAAEGPQSLGPDYYDFDGSGSYATHVPFTTGDVDRVILRLNGTAVPEAGSLAPVALSLGNALTMRATRRLKR